MWLVENIIRLNVSKKIVVRNVVLAWVLSVISIPTLVWLFLFNTYHTHMPCLYSLKKTIISASIEEAFIFDTSLKLNPTESALINSSSLPHHSRLFLLFSADDDADNKDVIGNLSPCERIDVSISYNVILSHRLLVIVGNSRELVFLYWHAICHLEVYFVVH